MMLAKYKDAEVLYELTAYALQINQSLEKRRPCDNLHKIAHFQNLKFFLLLKLSKVYPRIGV